VAPACKREHAGLSANGAYGLEPIDACNMGAGSRNYKRPGRPAQGQPAAKTPFRN